MADLDDLVAKKDVKGIFTLIEAEGASKALWGPAPKALSRTAEDLAAMGEKAVDYLLNDMFGWENPWDLDIRCVVQAIRLLGAGNLLIDKCLTLLTEGRTVQRYIAASSLSELFGPTLGIQEWPAGRSLQPLVAACSNENRGVRLKAVPALGSAVARGFSSDSNVFAKVIAKDSDDEVRGEAVRALGRIGDPASLDILLNTLENDRSEFVRSMTAVSLGELGDKRAKEALRRTVDKAKKSKEDRLERNARAALEKIGK